MKRNLRDHDQTANPTDGDLDLSYLNVDTSPVLSHLTDNEANLPTLTSFSDSKNHDSHDLSLETHSIKNFRLQPRVNTIDGTTELCSSTNSTDIAFYNGLEDVANVEITWVFLVAALIAILNRWMRGNILSHQRVNEKPMVYLGELRVRKNETRLHARSWKVYNDKALNG